MADNIINAVFGSGICTVTTSAFRANYGMVLRFSGIDLPTAFECDFSNYDVSGKDSVTAIGQNNEVQIPDQLWDSGLNIYAYVYLHPTDDSGVTVYTVTIPVLGRPNRTDEEPTPHEQSLIEQAISALNDAVEQTADDVETTTANAQAAAQSEANAATSERSAAASAGAALASQNAAESASQSATESATEAAESARNAALSASTAAESATAAQESAEQAERLVQSISGDVERAERAATTATDKATEASGSAATASSKANEASASATAAAQSASSAASAAQNAAYSAQAAQSSATDAEQAKQDAQNAQAVAEQAAQSVSASAAQIAKNTDNFTSAFSASTAYAIGDYCVYNGSLYKAINAHTGAWNAADFEEVTVAGELGELKSALTSVGGINSFAVDSYTPTWNMWDGSWGLSNTNPVNGSTMSYMVFSPVIPVTAGQYYSIGVLDNPIYSTKCKVIGVSWRKGDGTRISTTNAYPQGGYLKWVQAPATAEKAYVYFNSNNASVALSPADIYSNNFKVLFANRLINFTNRDSAGQYAIKENEWLPSYLLEEEEIERVITHTVSVGPTNSNFTSLRAALDAIVENGFPSETNRFEVQIKEGTYDIASYFTAAEKATAGFVGLTVPDWVTLKGVGNREKTILQYVLETASNNICVLNLQNTCSLENLTLYGVKTRYCVHDDKANYIGTPYKRFCKNVHFKGDTMTLGAVYGAGINSNAEWTFEDCIFESLTQTGYQNCFSVHGSGQAVQVGSSSVTFNNCRFIGYGTNNSVILSTLMNNASYFQNYCKFMGCSANGRLILREENASTYGAGIAWWATGFATTFTDEIISNTDGIDYSDHVDII